MSTVSVLLDALWDRYNDLSAQSKDQVSPQTQEDIETELIFIDELIELHQPD